MKKKKDQFNEVLDESDRRRLRDVGPDASCPLKPRTFKAQRSAVSKLLYPTSHYIPAKLHLATIHHYHSFTYLHKNFINISSYIYYISRV